MNTIVYVSSSFDSVQKQLARAFHEKGYCVQFFYYSMRHCLMNRNNCPEYVKIYNFKNNLRGPIFYLLRLYFLSKKCEQFFPVQEADCLYGNMTFEDGTICRLLAKKYRKEYCVSLRNADINTPFLWKIPWIKYTGIANLRQAKQIIIQSLAYKEKLLDKLPAKYKKEISEKIVIIPNAIDDFWIDNSYKKTKGISKPIKLLTVGRIIPIKNHLDVAQVVENLIERGYDIKYFVIGQIGNEEIERKLRKYKFVTILPFEEKEKLINRYRESDIFIMPSVPETFGLVYLEALTQGLPLIYSKNEGFDKLFPDGFVGYPVVHNEYNDIETKIIDIISNYKCYSVNAVQYIDNFRWSVISDKYLKCFGI